MVTTQTRDAETDQGVRPGAAVATGTVAGLTGGVGFGILMQTEGMLPVVASLVGGNASSLGWVVHMAISVFVGVTFAIIGVSFAVFFSRAATGFFSSTLLGLLYGGFWWILGGLFLMPVWLGVDAFTINAVAWKSLAGHLIYGVLLGAVYGIVTSLLSRRRRRESNGEL